MGLSLISTQRKTYLNWTVKIIFGLLIFSFVFWKVKEMFETQDWSNISWNSNAVIFLLMVFFLMFANWSFEAVKWKILLQKLSALHFVESLKGVLSGLATGLITPNRAGNFIGRIVYLEKEIRLRATIRTFYANLVQFSVTLIFGAIGLTVWSSSLNYTVYLGLVGLTFAGILISFCILFNPKFLLVRPFVWLLPDQVKPGIIEFDDLNCVLKIKLFLLSTFRYFIFVIQYVLVFFSLNFGGELLMLVSAISVMYLIMTLIPSLFLGKLFVREAAGLIVFSTIGIQDNLIILAGFMVWFINIALPGLIGASLLLRK